MMQPSVSLSNSSNSSSRPVGDNATSTTRTTAAAAVTSSSSTGVASLFTRLLQRVEGCHVRIEFDKEVDDAAVTPGASQQQQQQQQHAPQALPCFSRDAAVCGAVVLTPTSSAAFAHRGVTIQLTGTLRIRNENGSEDAAVTFMQQEQRYEAATLPPPPQPLSSQPQSTRYAFDFAASKVYESYVGTRVDVLYTLHATVVRPLKNLTASRLLWVTCVDAPPRTGSTRPVHADNDNNNDDNSDKLTNSSTAAALAATSRAASPVRGMARELVYGPHSTSMEVGVDDTLHIEFRFSDSVFDLHACVYGVIVFKLATLDIRAGEVSLLRKEYVGADAAANRVSDAQVLYTMDVMDGAPIVGEVLPIRLFLRAVPQLTPTYVVAACTPYVTSNTAAAAASASSSSSSSHDATTARPPLLCRYSVRYFVSVVLVGSNGRRYFKQQELTLYRKHGQEPATVMA